MALRFVPMIYCPLEKQTCSLRSIQIRPPFGTSKEILTFDIVCAAMQRVECCSPSGLTALATWLPMVNFGQCMYIIYNSSRRDSVQLLCFWREFSVPKYSESKEYLIFPGKGLEIEPG
jgi:hypothetical protein